MSVKAKGSSIEKVLKEFNKHDIDEQVVMFENLKQVVTEKLQAQATTLQEAANKYLSIKERINKDE